MAEADGTEAPPMPSAKAAIATSQLSDAEIVSLVSLTAAKTDLKVSELRLRRRVAALELAELSSKQSAIEANSKREELEEELVRTKDAAGLTSQQGESREATLRDQISQLRQAVQAMRAEQAQAAAQPARRMQPPPIRRPRLSRRACHPRPPRPLGAPNRAPSLRAVRSRPRAGRASRRSGRRPLALSRQRPR